MSEIIQLQKVVIWGKRVATRVELEDNEISMTALAEELLELADFQLTCLPKLVRFVRPFELRTERDLLNDKFTTYLRGVLLVDVPSCGNTVVITI